MGLSDDVFADDAAALCDTDGDGESLTYYPYAAPATPIPFVGIVSRQAPEPQAGGQFRTKRTIIRVPKADVTSVNITVDKIGVPDFKGGTAQQRTVAEILGSEGGFWRLRIT